MPRGHGEKYTRLREVAMVALLSHPTIGDAAAATGISEKALRLWMAKPDFAEAVRTLRQQVLEAGATRLTGLVSEAIQTLEEGLKARKAADRTRAARAILEFRERMDRDQLRERVETLERQLADLQRGGRPVVQAIGVTIDPAAWSAFVQNIGESRVESQKIQESASLALDSRLSTLDCERLQDFRVFPDPMPKG